ncbi:MAG: DUF92 domain-containing protein [Bacteroidota bacterium]
MESTKQVKWLTGYTAILVTVLALNFPWADLPNQASYAAIFSIALGIGGWASKKIDAVGAAVGVVLTYAMFLGGGWQGIGLMFTFFVLGSLASRFRKSEKINAGLEQENAGKRTLINALANGGIAGLCGLVAWIVPEHQSEFVVAMTASITSALGDTCSSELGNVWGKRYIHIFTFKADQRGKDGVISLEGSLAGISGSLFIALMFGGPSWLIIWVAGILGNVMDSLLGGSFQQKGLLDNDLVNLLSTLFAALIAYFFYLGALTFTL